MELPQILIVLYLLIAVAAVAATRAEARAKGGIGLIRSGAGLVACALWPLVVLAAAATLWISRRAPADQDACATATRAEA